MIFLMTHIIYSQPPERELMKFSWDFRDQSGSESDDQKTEDRWFSEIDTSCSSECSSTRDFSESSDVGDSLSEVSMRQCDCMSLGIVIIFRLAHEVTKFFFFSFSFIVARALSF